MQYQNCGLFPSTEDYEGLSSRWLCISFSIKQPYNCISCTGLEYKGLPNHVIYYFDTIATQSQKCCPKLQFHNSQIADACGEQTELFKTIAKLLHTDYDTPFCQCDSFNKLTVHFLELFLWTYLLHSLNFSLGMSTMWMPVLEVHYQYANHQYFVMIYSNITHWMCFETGGASQTNRSLV